MASQILKSGRGSRGGLSGAIEGGFMPVTMGFEDGGRRTKSRNARWLLEAGKEEEMNYPLEPPERNTALLTH